MAPDSPPPPNMAWTVFLDRDGVLNRKAPEGDYVKSAAEWEWLPGAIEAVRRLRSAGVRTVVVTNQRGVSRGVMTEEAVARLHEHVQADLAEHGTAVAAFYVCPHGLGECRCRKPAPGLFLRARDEHAGVRFDRAFVVGDADSDIEAGRALGCRTVRIASPHVQPLVPADATSMTLLDAVTQYILPTIGPSPP